MAKNCGHFQHYPLAVGLTHEHHKHHKPHEHSIKIAIIGQQARGMGAKGGQIVRSKVKGNNGVVCLCVVVCLGGMFLAPRYQRHTSTEHSTQWLKRYRKQKPIYLELSTLFEGQLSSTFVQPLPRML